jgi:ABC-type antimicrobial peptide transport system permease subunit
VTVVGVTARSLTRTLDRERPTLYVRFAAEHLMLPVSLVTRSATAPSLLVRPITDAAQALDPNVAMHTVKTMERRLAVQLWPFRTASSIFGICGALALLLATAGLTGVVIHAVQRRVREFGVRLSVGAAPRDLMVEVLRGAVKPLVPGVVIGIAVAAAVTQLLQAAFVGVNVLNPLTFLAVAGVQVLIVLLACLGPAHRASRTDPLTALRTD